MQDLQKLLANFLSGKLVHALSLIDSILSTLNLNNKWLCLKIWNTIHYFKCSKHNFVNNAASFTFG